MPTTAPATLPATPPTTSPTTLYRLSAVAGFLCALILLINAGRRGGVIANSDLTHVIAPLGEVFGLVVISGLYFRQRGQGVGSG